MTSIQFKLLLLCFTLSATATFAQVGIGTTSPHPSAILEIDVSTLPANAKRGLLPPRLSTTERNAMTAATSPTEGLMIYNTTTNCIETYNGDTSSWDEYCSGTGGGGGGTPDVSQLRSAGLCSAYAEGLLTAGTGRSNAPSDILSIASRDNDVYTQYPTNFIPDPQNPLATNRLLSDAIEADGATLIDYLFAGTDPTNRDFYHLALGSNGIIYWANVDSQLSIYSMSAGPEAIGQTSPSNGTGVNTRIFKIEHPTPGRTFVALLGAANEDDNTNGYTANFALDDQGVVYSWGGRNLSSGSTRSRAAARFTSLFRTNPANESASTTPAPATFINNIIAAEGGIAPYTADGGKHTATYFAEAVDGSTVGSEGVLFAFVSGNGDVIVLNSRATNLNNANYYKYTLPGGVRAISVGSINGHYNPSSSGKIDFIFVIGDDGNVYMNDVETLGSIYTGKHTFYTNYTAAPVTEELKKIIDKGTEQNIVDMIGVDRTNYVKSDGVTAEYSLLLLTEDGKYFAWDGFRTQTLGTNPTTFFPTRPEVSLNGPSVFEPNVDGNPGTNLIPPIARFITAAHSDDNVSPRAFGLIAETTDGKTIYVANFADAQIRNSINGSILFRPPVPALTGSQSIDTPAQTAAQYLIRRLDGSLLIEGPVDMRDNRVFDEQRYFTLLTTCISK